MYKFLRFFDKGGIYLNFEYDEANDKWKGRLDFGTISEGLVQVQSIFVLEEVLNTTTGIVDYSRPITDPSILAEFDGEFYKTPIVNDIFMFSSSQTDLQKEYTKSFDTFSQAYTLDVNGRKEVSSADNAIMQIDFAFMPSDENGYQTTFYLKDQSSNTILELTLYGEGEDEDERLRDLLMTIGNDILPSDSIIFDTSNVNEQGTDWNLINRKRKELLLEYQNIFPYVGSYKALINILKFYGYQNVRMKEYWKNVDMTSPNFGKLRQTNIIDLFSDEPDPQISKLIPSKIYKKTNLFGLFYDITVATNEYDERGIPIVEEVYTFTPEEVLIKLFALKRKLQDYYLPLNSKIVDIIGEAIYFANYRINVVTSQNRIDSISLGVKPKFDIIPSPEGMIQDLRPLQWRGAPVGYDIGASGFSNFKVWMPIVSSGATVTPATGYATLYMTIAGMTAGRVELRRDLDRGNYFYSQNEIRDLLVDSFNNPSYISGFNNVLDIQTIKNSAYAYADDSGGTAGQIRVVEKIPYFGSSDTVDIVVVVTAPMSVLDAPSNNSASALDPSPGGSFGPTGAPLSFFKSAYIGYFENSKVEVEKLNDAPDIPVGYPIILKNQSFNITWDNANATFDQVDKVDPQNLYQTRYSQFNTSFIFNWSGMTGITWQSVSDPVYTVVSTFPNLIPSPSTGTPFTFDMSGPYTWENLGYYGHVEMQWIVSKEADENPAFYYDSGQKPIQAINEFPIILPYVGDYTVKLKLWDLYNMQSFRIDEGIIKVRMPEADYISWYSKKEKDYLIDTPKYPTQTDRYTPPPPVGTPLPMLTWDDYASTWDLPFHPNEPIEMAEISANSLDSIEFYQTIINPSDNPLIDRYAYTWNLIGNQATWDDAYHLWWDNTGTRISEFSIDNLVTSVSGPTSSVIYAVSDNDAIAIKNRIFNWTQGPTGWDGPTAIGTGYTAGHLMFVDSNQYVYLHNGTDFVLSDYEMDAVVLPYDSSANTPSIKKQNTLDSLAVLNDLDPVIHPILSRFIYYYNEEYDTNYLLQPHIKGVSKEFDRNHRVWIKIQGLNNEVIGNINDGVGTSAAYNTVYFGYLGDIPAHFEIASIPNSGGTFTINYLAGNPVGPTNSYTYTIPAGITTLSDLCNELNGSTAQSTPILGDFVYNMVYGASGWTGGSGPSTLSDVKLQGVLKRFTNNQIINVNFGTNGVIGTSYGRSLIKNPTWDDLRILKYADELPILSTVNFTYDNSKIKGKSKSYWKLTKEDDLSFSDIYYNNQYFSYMFNQRGSYTVSLTLEDSNGNKKTIKKPEIIKIV